MKFRLLTFVLLFLYINSAIGQLSIKNPQICHDKDNYLKCYNDGTYILKFGNGDFKGFMTSDSTVIYSNIEKEFTFYRKSFLNPTLVDTVKLKLLPKSILVQKGQTILEINSLAQIPEKLYELGIGTFATDNKVDGFVYYSGDKYFEIKVWTYDKIWSWDIKIKQPKQRFAILYNNYKNNRLDLIFIQNDSLKYGMVLGTTFKSLKKIDRLKSDYTDSVGTLKGFTVISSVPLDKYYDYEYDKKGRLKTKTVVGELKLCECD